MSSIPHFDKQGLDYDELSKKLKEYGVVVIDNFYNKQRCDQAMDQIITSIEKIGSGVDRIDIKGTWKAENLPPQTRAGMFQGILCNHPVIWKMRNDKELHHVWHEVYQRLNPAHKKSSALLPSVDGINIKPNGKAPYHRQNNDWAHMDQTIRDATYKCVQGQVVLTNTTASFVCSPKSHLVYEDILDLLGKKEDDKTNWAKISRSGKEAEAKALVEQVGGEWQIPVQTGAGSVILWLSSCVHSAKHADKKEPEDPNDIWKGWRGVFYICYRPQKEFTKAQLDRRQKNIEENRVMNHWQTGTFPKNVNGRYGGDSKYHVEIRKLINDPDLFYKIVQ